MAHPKIEFDYEDVKRVAYLSKAQAITSHHSQASAGFSNT